MSYWITSSIEKQLSNIAPFVVLMVLSHTKHFYKKVKFMFKLYLPFWLLNIHQYISCRNYDHKQLINICRQIWSIRDIKDFCNLGFRQCCLWLLRVLSASELFFLLSWDCLKQRAFTHDQLLIKSKTWNSFKSLLRLLSFQQDLIELLEVNFVRLAERSIEKH